MGYGHPNLSEEGIFQASKLAYCDEFISGFSNGHETKVGERKTQGSNR